MHAAKIPSINFSKALKHGRQLTTGTKGTASGNALCVLPKASAVSEVPEADTVTVHFCTLVVVTIHTELANLVIVKVISNN